MEVITRVERRRRHSAADKERVLAATDAPGACIADVAKRFDMCRSLIHRWRRERREAAGPAFVPVAVAAEPAATPPPPEPIEILLPNGVVVRVPGSVDPTSLKTVLAALGGR